MHPGNGGAGQYESPSRRWPNVSLQPSTSRDKLSLLWASANEHPFKRYESKMGGGELLT